MGMNSASLDYWRIYFGAAKSDIFDVIEHSILVAATDYPTQFRLKRDKIAHILFSCTTRCSGCDRLIDYDQREAQAQDSNTMISNYSGAEAQGVIDEEQNQVIEKTLRIKQVLDNFGDVTDSVLLESLRRLQFMAPMTVNTLKESRIGKSVGRLRKHASVDVRNLARTLIDSWKQMVDEWVFAREALATAGPGVDDDGTRNSSNRRIPKTPNQEKTFSETTMVRQVKKQGAILKPMQKLDTHMNGSVQHRVDKEVNYPQKTDKVLIPNCRLTKSNSVDEVKLEAAKRKLQQNYKQIENAKRQRTIRVMEINELPKQGLGHKQASVKFSVQSQNRMNGRR